MILDALDRRALRSRADRMGFRNAGNLEKLAADFDAHAAISRELECHLRGGLCMPFHVGGEAHRISVDIDLYTPSPMKRVMEVVPGALEDGGFASTTVLKNRPSAPLSHLVRLMATFQSHFGARVSIYVDIACGIDAGMIDTVTIPAGRPVLGFQTEHAISVLSRGSLIADKMPSLAVGTVGYGKLQSTPKQIYDAGTLVQYSGAGDLESALSTYETLSDFKLAHDSRGHGRDEVAQSIVRYLEGIGAPGATAVTDRHWRDFGAFSRGMLPGHRSGREEHEERILLCLMLARSIAGNPGRGAPRAGEAARLYATLRGARDMGNVGARLGFLRGELGLAP